MIWDIIRVSVLIVAAILYFWDFETTKKSSCIVAIALSIVYIGLVITTNINPMCVFKILFVIFAWIFRLSCEKNTNKFLEIASIILTGICALALVFGAILYFTNISEEETSTVETNTYELVAANDITSVSGEIIGALSFVHGRVGEDSLYRYYYRTEDGAAKLSEIPANDTLVYDNLPAGKTPYLEKITTKTRVLNYNKKEPTEWGINEEISYKLYVPKGSINEVYVFDAA